MRKFYLSLLVWVIAEAFVLSLVGCSDQWTVERVEQFLTVGIPSEASDITISGRPGRGGFLELNFYAPPDAAQAFVREFCDGLLYPGYDPWNSMDSSQPGADSIMIKWHGFVYYSSSNAPVTIQGNRCPTDSFSGVLQILLNTSNASLYEVKLATPANCTGTDQEIPPCNLAILDNFVYPIETFPLMVFGLEIADDGYVLVYEQLCIETQRGGPWSTQEMPDLPTFAHAQVKVFIDNHPFEPAYISETGRLVPVDLASSASQAPHYCISPELAPGVHTASLEIIPVSGTVNEYSWDFSVR